MPIVLAQPRWKTDPDGFSYWGPPPNTVDWEDLRSNVQCGTPGPTQQGYGLMVLTQPASVGYKLGDSLGSLVKADLRRTVSSELGLGQDALSSAADTPAKLLVELRLYHGDPAGLTSFKPIRGSLRKRASLTLAGQEIWSSGLDLILRGNTIAIFQADYRRNKAEGMFPETLRRWTGSTMLKLFGKMSDELATQILPSEYDKDGWERPKTSAADNFNRSDSTGLGTSAEGWSWSASSGTADDIVSNQAVSQDGGGRNRADKDLSSDDHYAQVDCISYPSNTIVAPMCRMAPAANTGYQFNVRNASTSTFRLFKIITGIPTQLSSVNAPAESVTFTPKIDIDSSDLLSGYIGGVSKTTKSGETSITGNVRGGFTSSNIVVVDNFVAADLGGAALTKILSDSLAIADAIGKAIGTFPTESMSVADALGNASALVKTDAVAIAEQIVKEPQLAKADSVALADSEAKAIGAVKTDAVAIADVFSRVVQFIRAITDTVTITDSIGKAVSTIITDAVAIADAIVTSTGLILTLALSDIMTIRDCGYASMQILSRQVVSRMATFRLAVARLPIIRNIIRRWC